MFRHWLGFVQPLAVSFAVLAVVTTGMAQETPDSSSPPTEPAAAAADAEPAPPPPEAAVPEAKQQESPAKSEETTEPKSDPKPDPKPEPKSEPKTDPKPEPKPESVADADSSAAEFAAKLAEWKEVIKDLRRLRIDYRTSAPDKVEEIRAKWSETVGRAEALIETLRDAGQAAYVAAPNADEALTEFLLKLLADDVARDNYEPAASLAKTLLDNGCEKKEVFDPAAIAAFATNDFDAAETWSKRAQSQGTLSETGAKNMSSIPAYKKYWEEEHQIRQKEAEQNDLPRIRLNTSQGEIIVELFENEAPEAVGNFVSLVERKFYDGLVFHRVLPGFMAQGGCPRGDGTGDPGYKIYCECYQDNHRKHFRGTLSMAHAGRDTGGSQFFITFVPTPHLNGKHTAFGRVVEGMDVLAKLQRIDPENKEPSPILDKIITAEVIRKRDHEYQPRKVERPQ